MAELLELIAEDAKAFGCVKEVRHIGIAGTQQQQNCQDARQASVAVLKRMDLQEHDHEDGDAY